MVGVVGGFGSERETLFPLTEEHPLTAMIKLLYVPATACTVAALFTTDTPGKLPPSWIIEYVPLGTLVNVKLIVPSPWQTVGFTPDAAKVGTAFGAAVADATALLQPFKVCVTV